MSSLPLPEDETTTTETKNKRGPLLPRADLTNQSPEDDDDDDDDDDIFGNGDLNGLKLLGARPPKQQQPSKKRASAKHFLPVKSSGYGKSSSRPSAPIHRRRTSFSSHSLPASPANNSVSSISGRSSSSLRRHGDGSLAGSLSGTGSSIVNARVADNGVKNFKNKAGGGVRSRSPSPAPAKKSLISSSNISHHHHHHHHHNNGTSNNNNNAMKKKLAESRSNHRTPSPAAKRLHRRDNTGKKSNKKDELSAMKKKLKGHQHQQHSQLNHSAAESIKPSAAPLSPNAQLKLPSSDDYYKDYSQFDSDPTPVKEARRLSCLFHNRPSSTNQTLAPLAPALDCLNVLSSPLPRTARSNHGGNGEAPLSYSKALTKGLVNDDSLVGSAMKLFQSENDTVQANGSNAHGTAAAQSNNTELALFQGYTNSSQSHTSILSSNLFSRTSGIDTSHLRNLLTKCSKANNSTKQWELKKRLENKDEELIVVRTALGELLEGKEEFVAGAVAVERTLRRKVAEARVAFGALANEKRKLQNEVEGEKEETAALKEQLQELMRENESYKTKSELLSNELTSTKQEVGTLHRTRTEHAVALALAESKLSESEEQRELALRKAEEAEAAKNEAMGEAESNIVRGMELEEVREENASLKLEVQARRAGDGEVCKLLNVDAASVDFVSNTIAEGAGIGGTTDSFLHVVKRRIEEYQHDVADKKELESGLESCMAELEKAEADYQASLKTIATKEREMSELMKSIGGIQQSGLDRESEVVKERTAAEHKASAAERHLAECREQLLSLGYEKTSLEEVLEASEATCASRESNIANLRKDLMEKEEECKLAEDMAEDLSRMQSENESLKTERKVWQGREEAICKMMNGTMFNSTLNTNSQDCLAIIDDAGNKEGTDPFLNSLGQQLEEYQRDVAAKKVLEKELEVCTVELEKVQSNYQVALETITTKERDMSELMKSIGDIQRSSQDREQEVANQRKAAEDKAAAAEDQVVECREKLLSLGYEKKSLEGALETSKVSCAAHVNTITSLQTEIAESRINTVQHDSQLQLEKDLRAKAEEKEIEERAERIALAAQLNAQLQEHSQSQKQLRALMKDTERNLREELCRKEEESKAKDAEVDTCRDTITSLEAHQLSLKQSLSEQKSILDASKEEEIGRLKGEIANLESKLKSEGEKLQSAGVVSESKLRELEEIIRKGRAERKRMHNTIQELRGNVRVFARIRPFLPDDGEESDTPLVIHEGDSIVTVTKRNESNPSHTFGFDRVFAPSAGQDVVFDEVSEFVQSALDGYNVCLFSYGQTGSGKTHTTQGTGTGVMRGLIPRSIEQIASHKIQLEEDGWIFGMEITYLEIYNETLKDLLREKSTAENKHEIKVGADGRRTVTNLTVKQVDPTDKSAIEAILALAVKRRSTASTDMNATSSRSHSVFTLNMTAKHMEKNRKVRGTLNLVDLAGSERLDRSGAVGEQAKEAMSINKSLSSLADVFHAIGLKQNHVPFRNSRLTYLLQPALSGDGKTLMICNISPTEASVQESLCSLRFASKVNKCELGKAKRTIEEVKKSSGVPKRENSTVSSSKSGVTGTTSRNVKRKV